MRWSLLVSGSGFIARAGAILVADSSPCGTTCGNVLDQTVPNDVVCPETSYSSDAGVVFQQCITCELTSTYADSHNVTDQEWMLYNLRYATSFCLFGIPKNKNIINTPCLTSKACGPFKDAITYKSLSSKVGGYDYCDLWPVTDTADFAGCTQCLQAGNNTYLANFITSLQAGCEQKPAPGNTISIDGNIFSTDDVNVTVPSAIGKVDPAWFDQGPITNGAIVGIAIGGVVFLLAIVGCCVIWRGRKRRRAFLRGLETKQMSYWPTPLNTSVDIHGTPVSQRPLRNWDESPMSARSEKNFPRYFSPYSSQYNSPVSATEAQLAQWPSLTPEQMHHAMMNAMQQQSRDSPHIGMAYGGDEPPIDSKSKARHEAYEMQPVEGMGIYQPTDFQHDQGQQSQGYFTPGPPLSQEHRPDASR